MRNEWMEIFSQEGYRFCKVKPEETGVFYKYYEEGFHLVMFIEDVYKRQTLFSAWNKITTNYSNKRKNNTIPIHPLYEEMLITCHEMCIRDRFDLSPEN